MNDEACLIVRTHADSRSGLIPFRAPCSRQSAVVGELYMYSTCEPKGVCPYMAVINLQPYTDNAAIRTNPFWFVETLDPEYSHPPPNDTLARFQR